MMTTKRLNSSFYHNLGKLFYAIAAVDKKVQDAERNTLKNIVKAEWLSIDEFEADFKTNEAYQIEIAFDCLNKENKLNANKLFDDFINYKKAHESLFTADIKKMILKTANAIASSFSGKNKSELIMLAKLDINLK